MKYFFGIDEMRYNKIGVEKLFCLQLCFLLIIYKFHELNKAGVNERIIHKV
jgi:hypothetical protein